jgi:hypothetical protein
MRLISLTVLAALLAAHAQAQSEAPRSSERRERAPLAVPGDLEPAVDVGRTRLAVAQRTPTAPPPANPAPPATAEPAVRTSSSAAPPSAPNAPAAPSASTPQASASRAPAPRVLDTIDLGTTSITGNQELPKVLYIVPWKKSDLGDLVGRPVNTLLDEVLAPIDPEVFRRSLSYYESLHGKTGQQE